VITYKIKHHIPGNITIEVPILKSLALSDLMQISKQFYSSLPEGIKSINLNPFTKNLKITYEYEKIDIFQYLNEMASNIELQKLIESRDKKNIKNPY
jgi:hypothetical protein